MTTDGATHEKLDIGRVMQTTVAIVGRNFVALAGLSALLAVAPWVILAGVFAAISAVLFGSGVPSPGVIAVLVIGGVTLFALPYATFQGAAMNLAVSDLNGRKAQFRPSLGVGLRNALQVLAVLLLSVLASAVGYALLIVPGVMIALAFSVAVPVRVAEKVGVLEAFSRSRTLTRHNRWRILGLFLVYALIAWAVEVAMMSLTGGFNPGTPSLGAGMLSGLLAIAFSFISTLVTTTGVAVLYFELRRIKEGVGASDLAAVFD